MIHLNENFTKLKASYLFSDIAKRVTAFTQANPDKPVIRLGIGDVTEPLPPVCIAALHAATDEMAKRETFKGYGPEQGYAFLREAIAQNDYAARNCPIDADEIFVSDGAKCDCGNIQEIFFPRYPYSNFTQDISSGIYSFNGALNVYNCTSCGNSLQFLINDYDTTVVNGNVDIGTSLGGEYYPYMVPNGAPTKYYATFNCGTYNGTGTPYNYHWDYGDGTTWNDLSSSAYSMDTHIYNHPGKYHVKCWVRFPNSFLDSTEYDVRFGIPEGELQGTFDGSPVGLSTINFNPSYTGIGGAPYYYNWDFGDGNTSTQAPPNVTHTYANPGVYKVHLVVTDNHGGVAEMMKSCPTANYTGPYSSFYLNTPLPLSNLSGFSNVTVIWRDAAGNTYTSNNSAQPSSSYFKLLSVEDYQNNGNGEHTKKLHVNLKCKVYCQSTGDSLLIDNGDAVIAVAYQ